MAPHCAQVVFNFNRSSAYGDISAPLCDQWSQIINYSHTELPVSNHVLYQSWRRLFGLWWIEWTLISSGALWAFCHAVTGMMWAYVYIKISTGIFLPCWYPTLLASLAHATSPLASSEDFGCSTRWAPLWSVLVAGNSDFLLVSSLISNIININSSIIGSI